MALIVEDGSIVIGANSYVSVAEIRAYCEARGIDLPDDSGVEMMAVLAFDYIESFASKYMGHKTNPTQRTSWPRNGVVVDGYYLPSNAIPWQLKLAQSQATAEAVLGDLMPNPSVGVKREKIDIIEVEYQVSTVETGGVAYLPKVDTYLSALFGISSKRVRVVRG